MPSSWPWGCSRLAPASRPWFDDHLRVADLGPAGVGLHAVTDGRHRHRGLGVVEVGPRAAVLGREHQHLVDAAGHRLGEHRAEVVHPQGLVAVEGRVAVGHDPHHPFTLAVVGLERRGRRFFVAPAERTGQRHVGLHRQLPGDQLTGTCVAVDGDRHPPSGERIEAELAHLGGTRGTPAHVLGRGGGETTRVDTASTYRLRTGAMGDVPSGGPAATRRHPRSLLSNHVHGLLSTLLERGPRVRRPRRGGLPRG